MNEKMLVEKFKCMCAESIPPGEYSMLIDKILPALILSRSALKNEGTTPDKIECGIPSDAKVAAVIDGNLVYVWPTSDDTGDIHAVWEDFVNLQISPCGIGKNIKQATANLLAPFAG